MPTKIRLQRFGKKSYAFFHVVVADSRAPRDGKFIERIGTYNPNTNPATIDVDFDRALYWVKTGAQPTDTCKALLSYKGVLHKDHLDRGVLKGALTQAQADKKFEAWVKEKEGKIEGKKEGLSKSKEDQQKAALKAEKEANEKKAAAIAAKMTPPAEEAPVAEATEVEVTAEVAPDVETTAEVAPETVEEVVAEAVPEAKVEETPEATEEKKED